MAFIFHISFETVRIKNFDIHRFSNQKKNREMTETSVRRGNSKENSGNVKMKAWST